jgi:hypothetical protein
MRSLLKKLRFINAKDKDPGTPRLALALGRLNATRFDPDRVSQSHWIVFLDQTRLLWACCACYIDIEDIRVDNGRPGPYSATVDGAFAADRARGQKVVFLGSLEEVGFVKGEELKPKVHDLDWDTSPVSREQILAMSRGDGHPTLVSQQRKVALSKKVVG